MLPSAFCLFLATAIVVDSDDLRGTWRLVSVEAEEGSVDLPSPQPLVKFEGGRLVYGGDKVARVTADATTSPNVIDLQFADPDGTREGIYVVDKDSLKVCINGRTDGVKERPDSLTTKDHPVRRLLTFERVAADDPGGVSGFVGLALRFDD